VEPEDCNITMMDDEDNLKESEANTNIDFKEVP